MAECDKFALHRLQCFGVDRLQLPFLMRIARVVDFLKEARIETLEIYDTQAQFQQSQQISESDGSQSDY